MKSRGLVFPRCWIALAISTATAAAAADWPMWRGDAGRTGATNAAIPADLKLQWTLELPPLTPAWHDPRLQFDAGYQPIVVGKRLLVASSRNDSVSAYDTESGKRLWRFFAGGPIRFAPVAHDRNLYFGADDGCVYCLDLSTGSQLWRFNAALSDRRVLGNERLISVWPVRGGPVIHDGKLFFTVGIWPFEGTLLYTLDAERGEVLRADNVIAKVAMPTGGLATVQDRCPQGYLAVSGDRLYVPCGRSNVCCFDLRTGVPVPLQYNGSKQADYHVVASGKWMIQGDTIVDVDARHVLPLPAFRPAIAGDDVYFAQSNEVFGLDIARQQTIELDRGGKKVRARVPTVLCRFRDMPVEQIDLKAGNRLYGHSANVIYAIDLPAAGENAKVSWRAAVEGDPISVLTGDEKLFVVTREGTISCFGADPGSPPHYLEAVKANTTGSTDSPLAERAKSILQRAGSQEGYGFILGIDSIELIEQLVRQSQFHLIVLDSDAEKVRQLRERLDATGQYGARVAAIVADPLATPLPPYVSQLTIVNGVGALDDVSMMAAFDGVFQSLRPYGGTAFLNLPVAAHEFCSKSITAGRWQSAAIERVDQTTYLTRVGKLPGSANWTHEYGDPGHSLMSKDQLVKAPLGVLWFGGPSAENDLYYDRHMWGPSAAVVDGRMLIQGPQKLTAVDAYTGRLLWQLPLPDGNAPGRRANWKPTGFHFVADEKSIYLTTGLVCLRIDPANGSILSQFRLPHESDRWGRLMLVGDLLVVSVFNGSELEGLEPHKIVALDSRTGDVRWTQESPDGFPMVAIGNNKVFCYEGRLEGLFTGADMVRINGVPRAQSSLFVKAFAIETGSPLWETKLERVASWLAYSESQDVLLVSNKNGVDAWKGESGDKLWSKQEEGVGFGGHPENYWDRLILWKDQAIDQRGPGRRYDLLTGEPSKTTHPVTGEIVSWEFTKAGHHCNYAIASEHLITFRAASAGYCDLATGDTGRLEGFRSGCRNSLIPACGVLNAPNFATGCSCGYSVFTSLALVHLPEANFWTYGAMHRVAGRVKRLGINLGAPGDRQHDGTLWIGYSGEPTDLGMAIQPATVEWYSIPPSNVSGDGLPWVVASGAQGIETITIPLVRGDDVEAGIEPRSYTVRLHFAEPESISESDRVFDVIVGDRKLTGVDVFAQSGGVGKALVKELTGVSARGELTIRFHAKRGKTLLCGIELVAEESNKSGAAR